MDPSTRNLLFLLAAPLSLACSEDELPPIPTPGNEGAEVGTADEAEGSTDAGTDAGTGGSTDMGTDAGTGGTDMGTGGTDMGTTGGADMGSTGGTDMGTGSTGSTGDGSSDDNDGMGVADTDEPAYSDACPPYADLISECYGSQYFEESLDECNLSFGYYAQYGEACGAAFEEYMACLSALDCVGLETPLDCQPLLAKNQPACQP